MPLAAARPHARRATTSSASPAGCACRAPARVAARRARAAPRATAARPATAEAAEAVAHVREHGRELGAGAVSHRRAALLSAALGAAATSAALAPAALAAAAEDVFGAPVVADAAVESSPLVERLLAKSAANKEANDKARKDYSKQYGSNVQIIKASGYVPEDKATRERYDFGRPAECNLPVFNASKVCLQFDAE